MKTDPLFLDAADFPTRLDPSGGCDRMAPDPVYDRHRGEACGIRQWQGDAGEPLFTVFDMRWVFPDESEAAAFLRESADVLGEGIPPADAEPAFEDCRAFGGWIRVPTTDLTFYALLYLFRVGRVVGKLYAAEGYQIPQGGARLHTGLMDALVRKAAARIARQA